MGKIGEVLEQLKKMKPKALILFGSAARGEMKKDSDVDILIVKDMKESFSDRIRFVRSNLRTNLPLDILVLTSKEAREITKKSEFFSQIFKEGNYIYGEI
ncbi:hypothetical protein A3C98_02690 [Candidatus Roizmanbacteria bacterium RIFCSPHIGHO2_02_FULL_37_15]|nr:MAG: hypothetical protein A2859_05755 [Candidatus Roizmanbacteria bacterium RIFCSPHIGHO2_01_FULL_37_16b]OGK22796.1 MAG: hypothetical protein A3C98_02690 [Candidatus Roizmanbacteria bacterium RIFCSPHIGHO2_02_FULL_37_15]